MSFAVSMLGVGMLAGFVIGAIAMTVVRLTEAGQEIDRLRADVDDLREEAAPWMAPPYQGEKR